MKNFSTFFWSTFEAHKEHTAFAGDTPVSFWDWTRTTRRIALGLIDAGLEPGQRLAIVCNDRKAMFDFAFAGWLVGAVVAPIPTGRSRSETLKRLARTGSDWVVVQDRSSLEELLGTDGRIPASIRWVVVDGEHELSRTTLEAEGKSAEKRGKLDLLAKRTFSVDPNAPALIVTSFEGELHSSAFSGAKLKTTLESLHRSLRWEDETVALQLSLGWMYGFLLGVYALVHRNALVHGATSSEIETNLAATNTSLLVCGNAYLSSVAQTWESLRPATETAEVGIKSWISDVGARAVASLVKKNFRATFGKNLRSVYVAIANESPNQNVIDVFSEFDVDVLPIWGTEPLGITHYSEPGHTREGSVGRPVYGVACKTVDTKVGERGTVAIRTDVGFDSYWNGDGPVRYEEPWYITDAVGRIESGYLYLGES